MKIIYPLRCVISSSWEEHMANKFRVCSHQLLLLLCFLYYCLETHCFKPVAMEQPFLRFQMQFLLFQFTWLHSSVKGKWDKWGETLQVCFLCSLLLSLSLNVCMHTICDMHFLLKSLFILTRWSSQYIGSFIHLFTYLDWFYLVRHKFKSWDTVLVFLLLETQGSVFFMKIF